MDITSLVAEKLAEIDSEATIYREHEEQGFQEPCFFIQRIKSGKSTHLGKRSMRTYSYAVMFFPKNGTREECEIAEEILHDRFKKIDGVGHLYDVASKINDNVLQYQFNLMFRAFDGPDNSPVMQSIEEVSTLND